MKIEDENKLYIHYLAILIARNNRINRFGIIPPGYEVMDDVDIRNDPARAAFNIKYYEGLLSESNEFDLALVQCGDELEILLKLEEFDDGCDRE